MTEIGGPMRKRAFLFFGLGFAVAVVAIAITFHWLAVILTAALIGAGWRYGRVVRLLAFACGIATPYALFFGFLVLGPIAADYWHRADFESSAWRENDRSGSVFWPPRLTMIDDLLETHKLIGMSRNEVEQLLGPDDETGKWRDWHSVYWLGPERGLARIDSEWLVIRFDDQNTVSEVRIVRD